MRQRVERLFRTTTFRMAMVIAGVLLAIVFVLVTWIYVATVGELVRDADSAADLEFNYLERAYAEGGMARLRQEVIERAARQEAMLYALYDPTGAVVYEDITEVPRFPGPDETGHVDFQFQRRGADGRAIEGQGRGRIGRLLGGPVLLVVRDLGGAADIAETITGVLWGLAFVGGILAIGGGLFASSLAVQRVDALARVTGDVVAGDLTRRAAESGGRDEFDRLARALNTMLERLEKLVHTTRTAGDAIAHDLRTPLTRLRQRLENAANASAADASARAALQSAIGETDKLLHTFESILRVSRIESVANWSFNPVDVSALAQELAEFYEPVAEEAGISLRSAIEPGLRVKGEASLMNQALSNLIENAIKYTPAGGAIEVRVNRRGDGRLELCVVDDGPGVPEADRDRVQERFVRLESSRTTEGSGLGLSLVAAVARLHRGVFSLGDGIARDDRPGLRAALVLPALT
ncbi:MAG: ATP-binding protein [Hyphomonadaceae bacterium]